MIKNIDDLKKQLLEQLESANIETLRILSGRIEAQRERLVKELDDRSSTLANYPNLFEFDKIVKWQVEGQPDVRLDGNLKNNPIPNHIYLEDGKYEIFLLVKKVK